MRHTAATRLLLVLGGLLASPGWAQQPTHVTQAKALPVKSPVQVIPASQHVFGSIGIASKSVEARRELELSLDRYENAQYPDAVDHAKKAVEKDPNCAFAYALWSYAARWNVAAPEAVQKATEPTLRVAPDLKPMAG